MPVGLKFLKLYFERLFALSNNEDNFRVRLGKPRTQRSGKAETYLKRILKSVSSSRKRGYGRGQTASYSLKGKQKLGTRQVIIKIRLIKLAGSGMQKATLHLKYLQRDGVTQDGDTGIMYDASGENIDAEKFKDLCVDDRHQFRLIVSPEDAHEIENLQSYTRGLMQGVSDDLGTKLEWVAVDHYNTDHPHSHIIIRGVDDREKNLIISRNYLSYGMRKRAQELLTLELGPKCEYEINMSLRREVIKDRLTSLDRKILSLSQDHQISGDDLKYQAGEMISPTLLVGRLNHLEQMGLVERISPEKWHLSEDTAVMLKEKGEQRDIIKQLHRDMKKNIPPDFKIYQAGNGSLVGQVMSKGLSDEFEDRYYITVDDMGGQFWVVDVGRSNDIQEIPVGGIVSITSSSQNIKPADKIITEIAGHHQGKYNAEIHATFNPKDSPEFIKSHIRRLEAMRRAGLVTRSSDGIFTVPDDYLQKVQKQDRSMGVETLSQFPLKQLPSYSGVTWLDQVLVGKEDITDMPEGFRRKVALSLQQRQQYLVQNELAEFRSEKFMPHKKMLRQLRQIELLQKARVLEDKLALKYRPVTDHQRQVAGRYQQSITLASGKYAVLTKFHEFTLVPWRPVMEQAKGKLISGIMRGNSITWQLGRNKGIGR